VSKDGEVMTKESVVAEIEWYNRELKKVASQFTEWVKELGYSISRQEEKTVEKTEELSGTYSTTQFELLLDETLKLSLVPYGIWIIGAKGRIDIAGPSGREKLVYFMPEGPAVSVAEPGETYSTETKHTHQIFSNIQEEGWYWYDDSTYRRAEKFSKETVAQILERVQ
jgi:hypothetical protein